MTAPAGGAFVQLALAPGAARAVVQRAHAERLCEGHFPGDPLLPGAYLAGLMAEVGGALLAAGGGPPRLAQIVQCVFLARVCPDVDIVVEARTRGSLEVEAEIRTAGRCAARAVLRYEWTS